MVTQREALAIVVSGLLAAACAVGPAATVPASPATAPPAAAATATAEPTVAASVAPTPIGGINDLTGEEHLIDPGTYRFPPVLGSAFPRIRITVGEGWHGGGQFFINRQRDGFATVAVQFWDVEWLYAHPCAWKGTLFRPGPTVDDLALAIAAVPLRGATRPTATTVGGFAGKYLEWSVPADLKFSEWGVTDPSEGCDIDDGGGGFFSWEGRNHVGLRYQQGAGQLDRLWIIDVNGSRLVIDAFSMPTATEEELGLLTDFIEAIRFER